MLDFKEKYNQEVEKANQFLQKRKDAQEAGVTSYEDFQNIDFGDTKAEAFHAKIIFDEEVDLFWELGERERLIELHDLRNENFLLEQPTSYQKKYLDELKTAGSRRFSGIS
ncbi:hypothetical protein ACA29_02015 [Lederbergia galactosidilytica]|uniref:Uncharacterized protein n=1 Tax=Lederbergia galactosidilytica TaxID=217031 RepID=A0A0Q9Y7P5_9BACI|nr:hypothetical protein ACA29_02015 [Lederbergia galactosidilytica]